MYPSFIDLRSKDFAWVGFFIFFELIFNSYGFRIGDLLNPEFKTIETNLKGKFNKVLVAKARSTRFLYRIDGV